MYILSHIIQKDKNFLSNPDLIVFLHQQSQIMERGSVTNSQSERAHLPQRYVGMVQFECSGAEFPQNTTWKVQFMEN